MDKLPRIGFVGWNPFQFLHIQKLASTFPGACFVIEKRKDFIDEFSEEVLKNADTPIMVWDRAKMPTLDGVFDIIVCQTPFSRIETFEKSKIAMIQYGYAKEPHNYGPWRAFADVCLTYGPYAAQRIEYFSPAVAVGNPRYDDWHSEAFHSNAKSKHADKLNLDKKTVLYLPTWGDLSSVDQYMGAIYNLAENYNVITKMHHNTQLLESDRKDKMVSGAIHNFGANDDLLELIALADFVISDYSGAIFDAMYCKKPIALLEVDLDDQMGGKKIDEFSLEYSRRAELGLRIQGPDLLAAGIAELDKHPEKYISAYEPLRSELFTDTQDSLSLAHDALVKLWKGAFTPSQPQLYLRKELKEFYTTKRQLAIAKKKQSVAK
ncbi:glycosyl/glycerophosphate transferase, teichoic acid biosynthesis [Pseudomonas sp. GM84]|uniref:CDP-glycerol--glycerophosphate glycerophosphotransferase n=1 Tax=Pseudomonas sp. GM84 TaxID=1144340 RepID=UPI00026F5E88|nr:CDP-glycerol--glycerophosphate glycerophosphotransferase [Pseudomonas sp. GM84]EJN40120.1 glycosyl/glycerophosphate transferase, teichoic acid biosynthesis [Pseudomonas sp. GM84]